MSDRYLPARTDPDDEALATLLQIAGARPALPPDRADRLYRSTHAAWQAHLDARRRRSRAAAVAVMLAVAALGILAVRLSHRDQASTSHPTVTLARVTRIEGIVRVSHLSDGSDPTSPVTVGTPLRSGDTLDASPEGRMAAELAGGASVRLDVGTRVRLESASVLKLLRGAIYVDTGDQAHGLEVQTPFGRARDLGTQFEVRLADAALRVRVRTGIVELDRSREAVRADSGMELLATAAGTTRRAAPVTGAEWAWAARLGPVVPFDGQPLSRVLEALTRELGLTVRYETPALRRRASGIVLHGSIDNVPGESAVAVAVRTSGLGYRIQGGDLMVFTPRARD